MANTSSPNTAGSFPSSLRENSDRIHDEEKSSAPIVLSVSELTFAIKGQLEFLFRHIYVRGEVANLRKQHSGHIYFSLLEGDCQLNAVLFRGNATSLPFPLKDGDSIIASGELSVYPPKGTYQLIVREISPVGLGEALLKLQLLKKKLQALGWFREERKRPLPQEIATIGLVTSPTGAVLHDIINILTRRLGAFHIIVNPVRVQGEGASLEIARAIREFSQHRIVDVIIVCRGGGSSEDLSAFNDEKVAEACVQCTLPIVSAIGHETDLSITDLVADLRAPTPSAAAELVSQARVERIEQIKTIKVGIWRALKNELLLTRNRVDHFFKQLQQSSPKKRLELLSLRLDDIDEALSTKVRQDILYKRNLLTQLAKSCKKQDPRTKLHEEKTSLAQLEIKIMEKMSSKLTLHRDVLHRSLKTLDERMQKKIALIRQQQSRDFASELFSLFSRMLSYRKERLEHIKKNISSLHPQRTLERGYAIVFHGDKVVRSIQTLHPGENIHIRVADGECSAVVQKKIEGTL